MDLDIYEDVDNIKPFNTSGLFKSGIHKTNCEQFKSPRLPNYCSRPMRIHNNETLGLNSNKPVTITEGPVARPTIENFANNNPLFASDNSTSNLASSIMPVGLKRQFAFAKQSKKIILAVGVVALLATVIAMIVVLSRRQPKSATAAVTATIAALEPMITSKLSTSM